MFKYEGTQGVQIMILCTFQIICHDLRFWFLNVKNQTFIWMYELLSEMRKWESFWYSISVGGMLYSYLPNPSTRAGYDTRSIFKQSLTGLTGLISEFSFS